MGQFGVGANTERLFGRNEGGAQNFDRSVAHYVQAYREAQPHRTIPIHQGARA